MAKIKGIKYPKSKTFLCCFGSLPHKTKEGSTITGYEHNPKQKSNSKSWFPWQRIRLQLKNQSTKTVPLEGSESNEKEKIKLIKSKSKSKGKDDKVHSSKWKSKSNLQNKTQANPPPPSQTPPYQSPASQPNSENNSVDGDTCQQHTSSSTARAAAAATSRTVSLPTTSKRRVRRMLSSTQPQTTPKQPKQHQNAKRYSPVIGTCVVMVTLVIMILWGRLCAIVCTSVWLYFVPRFRRMDRNDVVGSPISNSNDMDLYLDLDSEMYKKRVILEGLLKRNHSGVL